MDKPPKLYAYPTANELAPQLRSYIIAAQIAALEHHGRFRIAVSGGSLPKILGQALLTTDDEHSDKISFEKWDVFFADERIVPFDHPDSNYALVKAEWIDKIPEALGRPNVVPIDTQYLPDEQEVADQYEKSLVTHFAAKDSVRLPLFDLLLLGCGPDGHTCSLFPGHELLKEGDAWVLALDDSPKPPPKRITLSLPVVTHALRIVFVATGGGKKDIMKKIFDSDDRHSIPCGMVNEQGGDRVKWFVDEPAVEGVAFPKRSSL